ncbi:MAG: RnfABCDGE type electron transport complex subunit D, partial [Alphaproteobacteria bacterium]|nr:RnfABCDGE type electron transport complex subunit D [Alphaproteobacteria bacterium]
FALLVAGFGMLVVTRAARWDTALLFLAAYAAIIYGRAWWLGDPWSIPLHQLKSGSLLIFAFFMITDPRSTPSAWTGRLIFAVAVAVLATWFRFSLYEPNGLIYALLLASLTTPLLDKAFPAPEFSWRAPKGVSHA